MKKTFRNVIEILFLILLGFIGATNYQLFVFPNPFAPAGINGIATIIQYKLNFSVGYMSLIINIPLFVITFILCDKEFAWKNMIYVLSFSLFIILYKNVIDISKYCYGPKLEEITTSSGEVIKVLNKSSIILAPIVAGVINGWIYGVSLKINSSTGGSDYIARIIKKYHPEYNFMWIIFIVNACVAGVSYFVYGYNFEPVICCIVYCFTTSVVSDMILKGSKAAIKFEVVTNNPEELSRAIITELKHDATVLNAEGMYTHKNHSLLICIINKRQVVEFQHLLSRYPGSFAYMTSINEMVGNFKRHVKKVKIEETKNIAKK